MLDGYHFGYNDAPSAASGYAASQAAAASSSAGAARRDLAHLEDRVERLALITMAMWSLLQDKTNLTEDDLLERVKTLDLMDGTPDGKATKGVSKCHQCQRTLNARHLRCLYCGAEKPAGSAFDRL